MEGSKGKPNGGEPMVEVMNEQGLSGWSNVLLYQIEVGTWYGSGLLGCLKRLVFLLMVINTKG